jgi:hypothetical protein
MSRSRLQEPFVHEIAAMFRATRARMLRRIAEAPAEPVANIIEDELRGLYHGLFVIFDGGSALAEEGLISIVDDDGIAFQRYLHEMCFKAWPAAGDRA